jgi:hypothetical protein
MPHQDAVIGQIDAIVVGRITGAQSVDHGRVRSQPMEGDIFGSGTPNSNGVGRYLPLKMGRGLQKNAILTGWNLSQGEASVLFQGVLELDPRKKPILVVAGRGQSHAFGVHQSQRHLLGQRGRRPPLQAYRAPHWKIPHRHLGGQLGDEGQDEVAGAGLDHRAASIQGHLVIDGDGGGPVLDGSEPDLSQRYGLRSSRDTERGQRDVDS